MKSIYIHNKAISEYIYIFFKYLAHFKTIKKKIKLIQKYFSI